MLILIEVSFRWLAAIRVWVSVGTVEDISVVVFNDVVSAVISGANCWLEESVWKSVSINEYIGCLRVLFGLWLSFWPFSVCSSALSVSLVSSVVLKTFNVLRLNESRPLIDFLFMIMFCFTRSVIMSAKASLVILEAVVLVRNQTLSLCLGVCG